MPDIHTPYGTLEADNARELLLTPADRLDRQVLAFFRRWQAVGIFLRCVSCGHSQKASESARHFPHGPECHVLRENRDFPWRELAAILQQLPK
jgi:hypothetical protein